MERKTQSINNNFNDKGAETPKRGEVLKRIVAGSQVQYLFFFFSFLLTIIP